MPTGRDGRARSCGQPLQGEQPMQGRERAKGKVSSGAPGMALLANGVDQGGATVALGAGRGLAGGAQAEGGRRGWVSRHRG